MISLKDALAATPRPFLLALSRLRGHAISSQIAKGDLVTHLSQWLCTPISLDRALALLKPEQQGCLRNVLVAGGHLPRPYLQSRYGRWAAPRPMLTRYQAHKRGDDVAPPATLEMLALLGLLFFNKPTDSLFIPLELQAYLRAALPESPIAPPLAPPPASPTAWSMLDPALVTRHDVASLLALCQAQPVQVLHQWWLSPTTLGQWGQAMLQPPLNPHPRSERQTGRRRFLHWLALQAGWLSVSQNQLLPTLQGWQWLQAEPITQLQALYDSWCQMRSTLWHQFRLPGYEWLTDPAYLIEPLHHSLRQWQLGKADAWLGQAALGFEPAAFSHWCQLQHPRLLDYLPHTEADRTASLQQTMVETITGPLCWLGLLVPGPAVARRYQLTEWGRYWLNLAPAPALVPPDLYHCQAQFQPNPLHSRLTLQQTGPLPKPLDQVMVGILHQPQQRGTANQDDPPHPTYPITAISFCRAVHQGWSGPALYQALQHLTGRILSNQEQALLHVWAEAAEKVTLQTWPILESRDPAVITRLASTRRGRRHIVRTLSNRAVVVDGLRQAALIKRLTEQEGVPPRIGSKQYGERSKGEDKGVSSMEYGLRSKEKEVRRREKGIGEGQSRIDLENTHVVLALQVYQALGQYINLPSPLPSNLLDDARAALSDASLAAVEAATAQTLSALADALIGRMAFPPWPEQGLSPAESLPIIEAALAQGDWLHLHYYALSTNTITQRTVEPYRLDWRGGQPDGTPYLVGFCQRAQAERLFRLDRIQGIAVRSKE